MPIEQRAMARVQYKDTDGDNVPDKFDCSPTNVMRQDWNIPKAKQEAQYVKWMTPQEYLAKTGLDPFNNPRHKRMLETYYDKETQKSEPIEKLGGYIKDPNVMVSIPFVGDYEADHEGRHRAYAAHLKGERQVPVIVRPPESWRAPEVVEAFIQKRFPDSGSDYKAQWRRRFESTFPQSQMDRQSTEAFVSVLKDKDLWQEDVSRPFKTVRNKDMTAAQRFGGANIQNLPVLGQGRDRKVYELPGQGVVVKVAKNPGGLDQNSSERGGDVKIYEEGKDYVIAEKVNPPGKAVKEVVKTLKPFSQTDFDNHTSELQDAFEKLDRTDLLSYDVVMGDLKRKSSWGEKYGNPVIVDGGSTNKSSIEHHRIRDLQEAARDPRKGEWARQQLKDWEEIKRERRQYKDKGAKEGPDYSRYGGQQVDVDVGEFYDTTNKMYGEVVEENVDGIIFPSNIGIEPERKKELIEHMKKTHDDKTRQKFDYVYKGRGTWQGRQSDDYEFDVFPKGQRWEGKKKKLDVQNTQLTPWNELKAQDGVVYRGMNEEEYNEAMQQGFFKSKGEHNIGQNEGDYTFGTKDIKQASSYASGFAPKLQKPQVGGPTGIIVGFKKDEKWEEGSMENQKEKFIPVGEMATKEKIPVTDVQEVYKYVPTEAEKGQYWAHRGWGEFERSIDHIPDTEGGWQKEEPPQPKRQKYYHGTSKVGSVGAIHEGLKTAAEVAKDMPFVSDPAMSDQTDPNYTYFFKDAHHADTWAKVVAKRTGFKPEVLEVELEPDKMERDFNMPFGESYKYKGSVPKEQIKVYQGDVSYPEEKKKKTKEEEYYDDFVEDAKVAGKFVAKNLGANVLDSQVVSGVVRHKSPYRKDVDVLVKVDDANKLRGKKFTNTDVNGIPVDVFVEDDKGNKLVGEDRGQQSQFIDISPKKKSKTVKIPLDQAWEMRRKQSGIGDMTPKREDYTMERIGKAIDNGTIDPIEVDYEDYQRGVLTDGKHRLNKYKEKGYTDVEIQVNNVPEDVEDSVEQQYDNAVDAEFNNALLEETKEEAEEAFEDAQEKAAFEEMGDEEVEEEYNEEAEEGEQRKEKDI
jgi:hypothetical protein